ncbi:MAG: hypothetical protein AAB075_03100, partial [Gemmatimonadota bacterium]
RQHGADFDHLEKLLALWPIDAATLRRARCGVGRRQRGPARIGDADFALDVFDRSLQAIE